MPRRGRRGGRAGRRRHNRIGGGFGFGRRRRFGTRFGRRRRRHRRGGGGSLLLCCFGMNLDPNQAIRKDVQDLQVTQQQFLTYHVQFQQQQQQQAALDPHTAQTLQVVSAEQAKEIQAEQRELLDDILKRQMEEKDPDKLADLQEQQNILIQQMQTFQASGFQYEGGIPQAQGYYLPQSQPMGFVGTPRAPDQLY